MPPPVVVVDSNFLTYRAFYSTGNLRHGGEATGVVYGFMRAVKELEEQYPIARMVFCFDYGKGKREEEFPWYKATRREKRKKEKKDPAKKKMWREFQRQVDGLRTEYLKRVGYANVFFQEGYEADDVIASVVSGIHAKNQKAGHGSHEARKMVIVTGDHDFYQLLHPDVSVYHPANRRTVTVGSYKREFNGLRVKDWVRVKAIAGCPTDDIPGVRGVAEKTAVKYLTDPGSLSKAKRKEIEEFVESKTYRRNLRLITLPLAGCLKFAVGKDKPDPNGWNEVMAEIGANSLLQQTTPWGGSEVIF